MGRSNNNEHMVASCWGVQSCAMCGTTIVLGEPSARLLVDGRLQRVCSACASEPKSALRRRDHLEGVPEAA